MVILKNSSKSFIGRPSIYYNTTALGSNATHLIKPEDKVTDIHWSKTKKQTNIQTNK